MGKGWRVLEPFPTPFDGNHAAVWTPQEALKTHSTAFWVHGGVSD